MAAQLHRGPRCIFYLLCYIRQVQDKGDRLSWKKARLTPRSTDYALRLLMLVGLEIDRLVTIEEVSDRFGISENHLMKVAYQFAQAGYLETVRGRNGWLRLGQAPSQIVVGGRPQNRAGLRGGRIVFVTKFALA